MSDTPQQRPDLEPGDEVAPGPDDAAEDVCPRCGGTGRVDDGSCPDCGGSGRVVVPVGGG